MSAIDDLATELSRLPGIGRKTALRLTYHLLRQPADQTRRLAAALVTLGERVRPCPRCFNLTEEELCAICRDPRRDATTICVVEQASEAELSDAAARADRTGLFNCPHTGVALAALEKLVARGEIARSERTVVVSTANGLKFTDFKVGYHESKLAGVANPKYANTPVLLPNDYTQVRDSVRRVLGS